MARLQALDIVGLGELAVGVGQVVLVELALGLFAKVVAVHNEQHAARIGVLDKAVGEGAGGVGLAGAGGHLDQRAGLILRERLLQAGDGFDLAIAHAGGDERRQLAQPGAQRVGFTQPFGEGFRLMEGEDIARARLRIARVAEEGFHACGFIEKPQLGLGLEEGRQLARIECGLLGDAGEQHAFFLGFDDTDRSAVQHQQVVAATFHERHFAQSDAGARRMGCRHGSPALPTRRR